MLNSSSEAVVVTEQGTAIKTRTANIRRIPESERLGIRVVPWSPNGSDNAFDSQVGMERSRGDGASDFEQSGLSEGCLGCQYSRTGKERHQVHSDACRRRIEGLLRGDSAGSTRLAATDGRINRAQD